MYNSTDREFIQKDPKAGNVYETLTQNGYIYCGDNPLYYIDPDGCSYISTLGNAGRTAFNVVKSGVTGGLGLYTRICCEIDNMPTWAKAAVGTTGIIIAGASGVGAAAIAEAVIASAGISAATDGAFYSIYALNNGSFSKSELKDMVINGAVNGYMFAGAGLGVAGIRNAAKSGKLAGFMADEAGSVSYEGGKYSAFGEMSESDGVRYRAWNYEKIHKISIHNPNADSMTLGKYFDGTIESGSYVARAELTGDTYFSLGAQWNNITKSYGLSDKEMFNLFNTRALDDAVRQGKSIRFSQNPLEWKGTALGDEWLYLQSKHNYTKLKKIGDYWYAK